jgi:ribosomal protein S18 acetylase RimI-like enzyme
VKIEIRELVREDRDSLSRLLSKITVFDAEDRAIAIQLVDIFLNNPAQEDYEFFVASTKDGEVIGYLCYGPTPLTQGTYDLYWIAVDPAFAGQGVGTMLLKQLESTLKEDNARLIVIETSSNQQYLLTRRFYMKNGYVQAETIKDFYCPGEDRVTFMKYLGGSPTDPSTTR